MSGVLERAVPAEWADVCRGPNRAGRRSLVSATVCAVHCARLLAGRRLHRRAARVGSNLLFPDGRAYVVFRESTCDQPTSGKARDVGGVIPPARDTTRCSGATLAVRATLHREHPAVHRIRRVPRETLDVEPDDLRLCRFVFLESPKDAESYGRYIITILGPLSRQGSVGFRFSLNGHSRTTGSIPRQAGRSRSSDRRRHSGPSALVHRS
jgi:hypothetical protein